MILWFWIWILEPALSFYGTFIAQLCVPFLVTALTHWLCKFKTLSPISNISRKKKCTRRIWSRLLVSKSDDGLLMFCPCACMTQEVNWKTIATNNNDACSTYLLQVHCLFCSTQSIVLRIQYAVYFLRVFLGCLTQPLDTGYIVHYLCFTVAWNMKRMTITF